MLVVSHLGLLLISHFYLSLSICHINKCEKFNQIFVSIDFLKKKIIFDLLIILHLKEDNMVQIILKK